MVEQRLFIALFLVISIAMITANPTMLSSMNKEMSDSLMINDLEEPLLVRNRRWDNFSWECTSKCASYNWCRIRSFTFGRCPYPPGCDCDRFIWEH